MKDVLLAIRADEATHRQYVSSIYVFLLPIVRIVSFRVNHKLADVGPNAPNPFLNQHAEEHTFPSLNKQKQIDTAHKK